MLLAVIFGLPLFGGAGSLAWPNGWAFLVLFFGFVVVVTAWLYRNNPGLLNERMQMGRSDQKTWDKLLLGLVFVLFVGWLVLMPIDAVRLRWSTLPVWLEVVGAILLLASFWLFFVTFRENTFLSPMVRLQTERGQTVVSSGPYAWVRHPMYAAFVLMTIGTPLLLGAWSGLLVAPVLIVLVARRAVLEERTLSAELAGYAAYMRRVRYRLVPFVW